MKSESAAYYIVDMPAEVLKQAAAAGAGAGDSIDGEPVWTHVGVFPARSKKPPPPVPSEKVRPPKRRAVVHASVDLDHPSE